MARIVKLEKNVPLKVELSENNPSAWICQCGLSNKFPFCDGSHKKAKEEDVGILYFYDLDKNKVKI